MTGVRPVPTCWSAIRPTPLSVNRLSFWPAVTLTPTVPATNRFAWRPPLGSEPITAENAPRMSMSAPNFVPATLAELWKVSDPCASSSSVCGWMRITTGSRPGSDRGTLT